MSGRARFAVLGLVLVSGISLVVVLHRARTQTPLRSTFTTAFQVLGAPLKLADRAATRMLPIGELEEREIGDVYRRSYDTQADSADADQSYLDALMKSLVPLVGKPFPYRAYVIDYPTPNAMALPGGVLLVTRELLSTLGSEAELVAVLAHELGHVEREHCFDLVRFELVTRRVGADSLGRIADLGAALLLRHSFSKSMEHEADEYAFELSTHSRYDPRGVAGGFRSLQQYVERSGESAPRHASPMRDYFASHPPLEIRAEEFQQRADAWWHRHQKQRRYVGKQNLAQRTALTDRELSGEWVGLDPKTGSTAWLRSRSERRGDSLADLP